MQTALLYCDSELQTSFHPTISQMETVRYSRLIHAMNPLPFSLSLSHLSPWYILRHIRALREAPAQRNSFLCAVICQCNFRFQIYLLDTLLRSCDLSCGNIYDVLILLSNGSSYPPTGRGRTSCSDI